MSHTLVHLVLAFFWAGVLATGGCSKPVSPESPSVGNESADIPVPIPVPDSASGESETDADHHESIAEIADPVPDVERLKDAEITSQSHYRITQRFPELNRSRLAAAGIHVLESRRLILLTDLDPEIVRGLPQLADEYFEFLERVCGNIRPAKSGADFRATGCLMHDFELFQSVDLVPEQVVSMRHGQQIGYRFWMRDQTDDYYRRHLLLHEFAHVYMTCDTGLRDIPDGWFMEGAAEVFATHTKRNGVTDFGVMPSETTEFGGWGRISAIRPPRRAHSTPIFERRKIPSMQEVQFPTVNPPVDDVRYAWWWALCWMLSNHPEYKDDWAGLCYSRG
ncbi:MAG: hypothetical protein MK102_08155, partial [Fuerstiella sp.]|nr:hypothetical protein [Fuerstiella sp.]